jgi:hypothetical protein
MGFLEGVLEDLGRNCFLQHMSLDIPTKYQLVADNVVLMLMK